MEYNTELLLKNIKEIFNNTAIVNFNEETTLFLDDFDNLSIELQLELFNILLENLKYYKSIQLRNINNQKCDKNGHIYSSWYEKNCFNNYNGSSFKNKIWCKKCAICGDVLFTFVKPKELIDHSFLNYSEKNSHNISKKLVK